jgi:phosphoribosylanthranilate isomerase
VSASVKFCGLTRHEDAAVTVSLGAEYLGVIFAPSPRRVSATQAAEVFRGVSRDARRVGVFPSAEVGEIERSAREASLDVVQLHGDPSADDLHRIREQFHGEVWGVARVRDGTLPEGAHRLASVADAIVLDAWSPHRLGGTGERFAWETVAREVDALRRSTACRLVLAGGLTADNVALAIQLFSPDVVDVSSGVEHSPGIKDHERMRAFARAALGDPEEAAR